jgi:UDP-N-acetylmuramate: L-alanyl-gamma-D-glutamyl-meso-diaminopimelate ligase
MRVHFIAIGGAVMHNLAIALHKKGYRVTGSDDEIFEPSRSRLAVSGLLAEKDGWYPDRITKEVDTVILGMHAKADNPELIRAKELELKIMSFPEYLYDQTKNKKRIVVAGSHGKTTTTAIIMHVMRHAGKKFDYMVGSSVEGFDTMVELSDNSEIAVFEGDEYLTSAIDRRPKFHLYKPDIAVINGIAWDHMNVFPTYDDYFRQFKIFVETITPGGTLIYFDGDPEARKTAAFCSEEIKKIPFKTHGYFRNKAGFFAASHSRTIEMQIFGEHNMQNLAAAREACYAAGISEDEFYNAIPSFKGASRRLQKIFENKNGTVYLDFAHAPSKVKATVEAVVDRYPDRKIIACLELHTFSSLNNDFLPQYNGTLAKASIAFIYFNPHALKLKKLPPLSIEKIKDAFGGSVTEIYNNSEELFSVMKRIKSDSPVFLLMSSGDFDGTDLNLLSQELLSDK